MEEIDLTKEEGSLIIETLIERKTQTYQTLGPEEAIPEGKLIDSICHKIGMYLKERSKSP